MQCSCGGETFLHAHEVKTLKKAQQWYPLAKEEILPIMVEQDECNGCGRTRRTILKDNKVLWQQG